MRWTIGWKMAAAILALAPASAAGAMDVARFMAKAEALEQKGPLAMFSSDYEAVTAELHQANHALKEERLAAQAAGRRPAYCPVAAAGLDQAELLAALNAVPPARRPHVEVKDALRAAYARKYPCHA